MRRRLEQRLDQLQARLEKIQGHLRTPGHPDSQENATEAENDEVLEHLDKSEVREIERIRVALDRIDAGIYGTCARCGEPIGDERLRALPTATCCIRCAA